MASNSTTSLKRKREDDEDVELYGDTDTMEKKPRGENKEGLFGAEINTEIGTESNRAALTTEVMEWLIFLVSDTGELHVPSSAVELVNFRFDAWRIWKHYFIVTISLLCQRYYVTSQRTQR